MRSANAPGVDGLSKARDVLPVSDDEFSTLFSSFSTHQKILLAVSGGRDSLALVFLAHAWCREAAKAGLSCPVLHAATVEHGLRADAADEARHAADVCARLGVRHTIVSVDEDAPSTGLQAWARSARYAALVRTARNLGCTAIATGHQADDQAETLLMRLARGSGLDGLSAMSAQSSRDGLALLRPLLTLPRARLTATLTARGIAWRDDPSNVDARFERSGYATFAGALNALGLTAEPISRSARRLNEARDALDWAVEQMLASLPDCQVALAAGYAVLPQASLLSFPTALRCRLLLRLIMMVSGEEAPPRLERLEALVDRLSTSGTRQENLAQTLGGCLVIREGACINVFREPGRDGFPVLALEPGEVGIWDRRFQAAAPSNVSGVIQVRAYGDVANPPSEFGKVDASRYPKHARSALPTFWQGDVLVSVPHLGFANAPYTVRVNAAESPDLSADGPPAPSTRVFSAIALPFSPTSGVPVNGSTVTE